MSDIYKELIAGAIEGSKGEVRKPGTLSDDQKLRIMEYVLPRGLLISSYTDFQRHLESRRPINRLKRGLRLGWSAIVAVPELVYELLQRLHPKRR